MAYISPDEEWMMDQYKRGLRGHFIVKDECKTGTPLCFYCKDYGHFAKYCPKGNRKELSKSSNPTQGRVYTLDAEKTKEARNLMKGMGFLFDNPIFILFVLGATHSFISQKSAETNAVDLDTFTSFFSNSYTR